MDVYKWYLFSCQLFSTVFDVAYTLFFLPVLFFPVPMGYTASRLSDALSISAFGGFCVSAAILGCLSAIILNLFTYRLNVVLPKAHVLSLSKLGHMYLSVGVATFCLICVAVALIGTSVNQAEAKLWAAEASVPTVGLTIPILLIIYSMAAAVDIGQGFANFQMFILGLHGTITSITVLLCNEPYRTFSLSFLPRQWWNNKEHSGNSRSS
ncbi:hypothetical protein Q1695_011536 [Nippostrongylus brasiliensis]|nr:hypothetical protein Q1695_011536 [Nippostrongylus brasiliensis]